MISQLFAACATVFLAISLCACGTTPAQEGSTSAVQNSEDTQEAALSSDDGAADEAAEVKAYMESEIAVYPLMAWYELGDMLDILQAGGGETVEDIRDSITEKADAFIRNEDVPLGASDYHYEGAMACSALREAAGYLYLSYVNYSDSSEYIDKANDCIDEFNIYIQNMNVEIVNIKDKYKIDINNPYSTNQENEGKADDEPLRTISDGTYCVGVDIEPGEYRLTAEPGEMAYMDVTDSSSAEANILAQDVFDTTSYITVAQGQYLTLRSCTAELCQ